jgi:hypothetical protein
VWEAVFSLDSFLNQVASLHFPSLPFTFLHHQFRLAFFLLLTLTSESHDGLRLPLFFSQFLSVRLYVLSSHPFNRMDTSNVAARSDLAAQFVRVEEWPAARPNFDLRPFVGNMRGMVAACSQPLRALEAAGQALAHDILCFLSARLSEKETTKTVLFVRAAHYEAHTLILDPFFHIRTMASDAIETISDFKQRVCNTEKAVHEVRTCLAKLGIAIKKAGWNLDIQSLTSAASVPTASPYQLRFETLFEREDVVAKLASQKDADLLREYCFYLSVQRLKSC